MPTYEITAPNGKVLEIDGAQMPTEAELHDIFAKAGVETGAKPATAPPAGVAPPSDPNTLGTAIRHFWNQVNPLNAGQLLPFPKAMGGSGMDHPLAPDPKNQYAPNFLVQMHDVKKHADQLWEKGDHVGATAKYVESFIPFLGPLMSQMGDHAQRGEYAALGGDTAGLATAAALPQAPAAVDAAAPAVKSAVTSGVRGAVRTTAAIADTVSPDVVGIVSPRAGKVLTVAQKIRDAAKEAVPPTPPTPVAAADTKLQPKGRGAGPRTINEAMEEAQRIARERAATSRGASAPADQTPPAASAPAAPARPRSATAEPSPAGSKPKLTAAESRTYAQLRRMGKTDAEAYEAIGAMRDLQAKFGLSSDAERAARVQARNATGRWQ